MIQNFKSPEALANLIASFSTHTPDSEKIQNVLRKKITECSTILLNTNSDQSSIEIYGLKSRQLLEACGIALLSRVDLNRVLIAYQSQTHSSFKIGARNKSSIAWSGDIFGENHNETELKINADVEPKKIDRALFATITNSQIWIPAIEKALENFQNRMNAETRQNTWVLEWLNSSADVCFKKAVPRIEQAFSAISKTIHFESLLDNQLLSLGDLKNHMTHAMQSISLLGYALTSIALNGENIQTFNQYIDLIESEFEAHK